MEPSVEMESLLIGSSQQSLLEDLLTAVVWQLKQRRISFSDGKIHSYLTFR